MGGRTVENPSLNGDGAALALVKSESQRMNALALNSDCFRTDLQSALLGEQTNAALVDPDSRPGLRKKDSASAAGRFCCDHCARKWKPKVAQGDVSFL